MASDYTPTNVTQGFGAEVDINKNFTDIKIALDLVLGKIATSSNAMGVDLDMGGKQILNLPIASVPTDPILLSQASSLALQEVIDELTYAATINVDVDSTTLAKVTLTGNAQINFTGTPNDGQPIMLAIKQDATGSRTVTWDARVRYSGDIPSITLTSTANALDYMLFRYYEDDDTFDLQALNQGF